MVISVSTARVQNLTAHSRWSCCNSRPRRPPRVLRGGRKFAERMARFSGILGSPAKRRRRVAGRQSKLAWGNRSTAPIPWYADWEPRPLTRWSSGEVSQRERDIIFSNCERFATYWFASCLWPIFNLCIPEVELIFMLIWFLKWQWRCEDAFTFVTWLVNAPWPPGHGALTSNWSPATEELLSTNNASYARPLRYAAWQVVNLVETTTGKCLDRLNSSTSTGPSFSLHLSPIISSMTANPWSFFS